MNYIYLKTGTEEGRERANKAEAESEARRDALRKELSRRDDRHIAEQENERLSRELSLWERGEYHNPKMQAVIDELREELAAAQKKIELLEAANSDVARIAAERDIEHAACNNYLQIIAHIKAENAKLRELLEDALCIQDPMKPFRKIGDLRAEYEQLTKKEL